MTEEPRPSPGQLASRPQRDVLVGIAMATGLIGMLFAPLWVIGLLLVVLGAALVAWATTTDESRLVTEHGFPRLWLFGLGAAGIAANLTTLRFLERTGNERLAFTISLTLFVAAMAIGTFRAARRYPS